MRPAPGIRLEGNTKAPKPRSCLSANPDPASCNPLATLLLGHTDSPAPTTSGLGVLATNAKAPVVTQTTVSPDFLQTLQIVTELGVDTVGKKLRVLAVDNVALPVEEPARYLELFGCGHDLDNPLQLFAGQFTGALAEVDIGLLADEVGVATTAALDLGQGVDNLLLALDIGVHEAQDVVEGFFLVRN